MEIKHFKINIDCRTYVTFLYITSYRVDKTAIVVLLDQTICIEGPRFANLSQGPSVPSLTLKMTLFDKWETRRDLVVLFYVLFVPYQTLQVLV